MVIVKRNFLTLLLKTMNNFLTGRTPRNYLTGMTKEEKIFWKNNQKLLNSSFWKNLKETTKDRYFNE